MRIPTREIRDANLRLEFIKDQITLLEDPAITIDPLDYLRLQLRIEENNVARLTTKP